SGGGRSVSTNEGFLSRWSRRKHDSRTADGDSRPTHARDEAAGGHAERAAKKLPAGAPGGSPAVVPAASTAVVPGAPQDATHRAPASEAAPQASPIAAAREPAAAGRRADGEAIESPPIDSLTPQSDFSPFMQAGVDAATRNAALAQLFRDPHFNVMDGLDVY